MVPGDLLTPLSILAIMAQALDDHRYQDRQKAFWPFMRRVFRAALRHPQYFWLMVASAMVTSIAEALVPLVWQRYIDDWITPAVTAFQPGATIPTDGFWQYGLTYLVLYLVMVLSMGGFIIAAGRLQDLMVYTLREQMFAHLQRLPYGFYDKNAIGHLSIRLTSDADKVARVVAWGFVDLLYGIFMIAASLVAMFAYNWQLSLVVLVTIPLLIWMSVRIRMMLIGYARTARRTYSEMSAYLTEHINGMEVNKTTVQETRVSGAFREVTERFRFASTRSALYASLYQPLVVVAGSLAAALVIYLGGHLALAAVGGITVGVLAAFFSYATNIFEPIFNLTSYFASAQDSLSAGERIFSLLDEPVVIQDAPGVSEPFPAIEGDILLKDLHFAYVPDQPIWQHLTLHIPAGQSVALVGATGSGKTTITNLIARFYEPQQGKVLIDGRDYRTRTLQSYREQLGIILQTPHLFSGTFRENLRYGKLGASDAEIIAALESIGATQFIDRLDEAVGEEGNNLSTGEKQLISFARALLKDPRILIMDEATSSVDTLAELQIQRGIKQMVQGRTSIIVAHRLSTIRDCDRILVIEPGRIVEDGSHEDLLARKGAYHHLYTVNQAH
jgi:ATP-binding cassette subfamily B protein